MPPKSKTPNPKAALSELAAIPDNELSETVEQKEGFEGLVETIHAKRKMQCYSITESELQQLSLVNTLVAFAWSIVSAIAVFLMDVIKDIMFVGKVPEMVISAANYALPLLLFALLLSLFGVFKAHKWRSRLIDLIKEESGEKNKKISIGRWTLQRPFIRK